MERDIDKRQTVEEAANEFCQKNFSQLIDPLRQSLASLFKRGAEWQARQSPWNDTTEKPVQGKLCLVEYKDPDGEIRVRLDKHCGMEWKEMCHYDKILRWAYVEDLLRKGGTE